MTKKIIEFLSGTGSKNLFMDPSPSPAGEYREDFLLKTQSWLKSSNRINLKPYKDWECCVSQGTTEAILDFNLSYKERDTFVLKGEYPYHVMVGARVVEAVEEIPKNSKLILSVPFSATGNKPSDLEEILFYCEKK